MLFRKSLFVLTFAFCLSILNVRTVHAEGTEYQIQAETVRVDISDGIPEYVEVRLKVNEGTEYAADSIGIRIDYDQRLAYRGAKWKIGSVYEIPREGEDDFLAYAASAVDDKNGSYGLGAGAELAVMSFSIPEDAQNGDVYKIAPVEDDMINVYNTRDEKFNKELIPYKLIGGAIEITDRSRTVSPKTSDSGNPVTAAGIAVASAFSGLVLIKKRRNK